MSETWADIKGFEGCYQISTLGRVKSCDRILPHKIHGSWHIRERILKARPAKKNGYLEVALHIGNGNMVMRKVHRLVAEAFIPNVDSLPEVNHIDGNKNNNNVSNLEWVSSFENIRHAWEHGLCANIVKAKAKPVINKTTGERFESIASAERAYGNSYGTISHALNGKHPLAFGCEWEYA